MTNNTAGRPVGLTRSTKGNHMTIPPKSDAFFLAMNERGEPIERIRITRGRDIQLTYYDSTGAPIGCVPPGGLNVSPQWFRCVAEGIDPRLVTWVSVYDYDGDHCFILSTVEGKPVWVRAVGEDDQVFIGYHIRAGDPLYQEDPEALSQVLALGQAGLAIRREEPTAPPGPPAPRREWELPRQDEMRAAQRKTKDAGPRPPEPMPGPDEPVRLNGSRDVVLGATYRDLLTGFQGMATAVIRYITGCTQVGLCPGLNGEGKIGDSTFLDWTRLVRLTAVPVVKIRDPEAPVTAPIPVALRDEVRAVVRGSDQMSDGELLTELAAWFSLHGPTAEGPSLALGDAAPVPMTDPSAAGGPSPFAPTARSSDMQPPRG